MAKLTASNGFYGHSGNKNYTNSAANHLYAGKSSGTSNYRSRMAFPSLRSHLGLDAGARIAITAMKLYLYRNDGGPTKVYAGCSTSSAWGAATAAYGSAEISASTGWHSVDMMRCAEAVAGYTGTWYIHLTGEGSSRIRFDGTGSSHKPYLEITWEYVAATIRSDKATAELGESVTFTITPEVEGETHTMTYAIGDAQGVIGENFGDFVTFALNPALAAEIPDDDDGTLDIRMTAYGPDGNVLRTERYFQTVKVPASMAAKVGSVGAELQNGLGGYGLTGRSSAILAPVIDVNDSYGATVKTVTATVTNGETVQSATWTEFEETEPGLFACAPVQTFVFGHAGDATVSVTVEDSRGFTNTAETVWTVCEYMPPVITAFSVQRYSAIYNADEEPDGYAADDLGDHVWANLAAKVTNVIKPNGELPEATLNTLTWRIDWVNPITGATRSSFGDAVNKVNLEQNMDVITEEIPNQETWNYTLTVTDTAGGTAVQYTSVQPGWANFALAASKHGAAFGGLPRGTVEKPMLESWYPFYAYEAIFDRHNTEVIGARMIAQQTATNVSVPNNSDNVIELFTAEEAGLYIVSFSVGWAADADGMRGASVYRMAGTDRVYLASSRIAAGRICGTSSECCCAGGCVCRRNDLRPDVAERRQCEQCVLLLSGCKNRKITEVMHNGRLQSCRQNPPRVQGRVERGYGIYRTGYRDLNRRSCGVYRREGCSGGHAADRFGMLGRAGGCARHVRRGKH